MEIGWPTDVQHFTHVTFDRFHGFLGLPVEFQVEILCPVHSASLVHICMQEHLLMANVSSQILVRKTMQLSCLMQIRVLPWNLGCSCCCRTKTFSTEYSCILVPPHLSMLLEKGCPFFLKWLAEGKYNELKEHFISLSPGLFT